MKKLLYIVAGLVSLMVSCQSDGLYDHSEFRNSEAIDVEDVESRTISAKALDFVSDLRKETRSGTEGLSVSSVYAWRACDIFPQTRFEEGEPSSDTLLYIVNFDNNNGYALVSANDNFDVVAYIESGNLKPTDEIDNPGFQLFLEGVTMYFASQLSDPPYPFGPFPNDSLSPFDPFPNLDDWHTIAFYAPLLSTNWGQEDPYNRLCYTIEDELALAGCVAVSIGQICAYHQKPISFNGHTYNWNQILTGTSPQTEAGKTSVSELIRDIGQVVNMDYGVDKSTANVDSINSCLSIFNLNYTYSDSLGLNFTTFENDLQNFRPAIMNGIGNSSIFGVGGHSWVIDGALVRERPLAFNANPNFERREYIHCNWGWDGDYNGYFISGAFSTMYDQNGGNPTWVPPYYNVITRVFYNIYPYNP